MALSTKIKKVFLPISIVVMTTGYTYAAPVVTKTSFPNDVNYLELDYVTRKPVEAYVKNTTLNFNSLVKYGEVGKSKFLSLNYLGAEKDGYPGECVSFIKAVTNSKPKTRYWYGTPSDRLTLNKSKTLPSYTPIATLTNKDNPQKLRYKGYDGKSHVALFLKQVDNGILVMDQNFNLDGKLKVHYISFSGKNQSNAGNYYVL